MRTIDNTEDIIDSRDVIERIEELNEALESAIVHTSCIHCALDIEGCPADEDWRDRGNNTTCPNDDSLTHEAPEGTIGNLPEDDAAELAALTALQDEAEGYAADWQYGETLIRDSYFTEYAQQLAEDIGAINSDASWPNTCIDWDQAARELQMDYTCVAFDGVDYWIR